MRCRPWAATSSARNFGSGVTPTSHVPRLGGLGRPSATPQDLCGVIVGEDHDKPAGGAMNRRTVIGLRMS